MKLWSFKFNIITKFFICTFTLLSEIFYSSLELLVLLDKLCVFVITDLLLEAYEIGFFQRFLFLQVELEAFLTKILLSLEKIFLFLRKLFLPIFLFLLVFFIQLKLILTH